MHEVLNNPKAQLSELKTGLEIVSLWSGQNTFKVAHVCVNDNYDLLQCSSFHHKGSHRTLHFTAQHC